MRGLFRHSLLCLCFALSVSSAATAQVVVKTFMLIPGIPGSSVDDRHKDWIDVFSLTQTFAAAGKKGNSCDVIVTKLLDVAGPRLWLAAVTHQVFNEIRIEAVKAGGDRLRFYEVRLTNARVNAITTSAFGSGSFEDVTLTADGATLSFFPQDPDGSLGPPVTATIPCS
jgi:type VI protein secretion system component Hcp